jgi:hypothetical protein
MANELTINGSYNINKGGLQVSDSFSDRIDVTGTFGPTPGAVAVGTGATGTAIDLSGLTTGGVIKVTNFDSTNFITVGIYDGSTTYYPLVKVAALKSVIFYLATITNVRAKADTATVNASFEAYEA